MSSNLNIVTRLTTPISELSSLAKSVLFAELSAAVYDADPQVKTIGSWIGFTTVQQIAGKSIVAYIFANATDTVLCFQGTADISDFLQDVDAILVPDGTFGEVHQGFRNSLDAVWPQISTALATINPGKPIWLTGHSLGAALSGLVAARSFHKIISLEIAALFTYGMPRIANKAYLHGISTPHQRHVYHHDLVPTLPEVWMDYRHFGREVYISPKAVVRDSNVFDSMGTLFTKVVDGLHLDGITDHSIYTYCALLQSALATTER